MTLKQLQYILTTAKLGSFSEAAKALYVSQPGISAAVKEIEAELGIHIFEKTNHGIALTQQGKEFINLASPILEQVNFIKDFYAKPEGRPPLRFFVSSQHYAFVVDAFSILAQEYEKEEYTIGIQEGRTIEILNRVAGGESDIGFIYMTGSTEKIFKNILASKNLEFNYLKDYVPHAYLAKDHPLTRFSSIFLSDLKQYPFTLYDQGDYRSHYLSEEMLSLPKPARTIYAQDRNAMDKVIIHNQAYTIGSGALTESEEEFMTTIPIKDEETMQLGWIRNKNIVMSPIARRFIDIVKNSIK